MNVLKRVALVIALLTVIFIIAGIFIPKNLQFERSIQINAPINIVWNQVKSLEAMDSWSPWNDYDPNIKKSYSGDAGTVGSIQNWTGNDEVGTGSQKIVSNKEYSIKTKLEFKHPWESESFAIVSLKQENDHVILIWGFETKTPFPTNVFFFMMNIEGMLSKDYDNGLSKLKKVVQLELEKSIN